MSPPPFSWRRELPILIVPVAVCLAVRLIVLPHVISYFHSDTAIGGLMAKHIWHGTAVPAYYYGQTYVGSLEMFVAAPFFGVFGSDPRGIALAHALLFSGSMVLFYRLFFRLGGRPAALGGSVVLALGTPWVVMLTTGRQYSYMTTLVLGGLLYLVGQPFLARPTRRAAFGAGALLGLAWWNNPQIAHFLAPLLIAAWAGGRVCALRRDGRLRAALPGRSGIVVAASLVAILAALVFCTVLAFMGGGTPLGISLTKPAKYIVRCAAALFALLGGLEIYLAADRRRFLVILGLLGAGFAVGHTPAVLAKLTHNASGMKAPIGIDPSKATIERGRALLDQGGDMLLGEESHTERLPGAVGALVRSLRWLMIGLGLAALVGVVASRWSELRVPMSLETLLLFQLLVVAVLYLTSPGEQSSTRYLLPMWVPAAGLAGWGIGRLGRWRRAVGAGVGTVVVLYLALGLVGWRTGWLPANHPRDVRLLIESLRERDATLGYGEYFIAYRVSYLSDEEIRIACYPEHHDRMPAYLGAVRAERHPFIIFNRNNPDHRMRHFAFDQSTPKERITDHWEVGPYSVYRYRRKE